MGRRVGFGDIEFCTGEYYRFGFNGQEMDNEITGQTGTHTTAMFWEYDSRLGRRWNVDPKPTASTSSYACFENNPITNRDVLGDTVFIYYISPDFSLKGVFGHNSIGVKRPGDTDVTYANASGYAHTDEKYIPNPDGEGGATKIIIVSEKETIKDYVTAGDVVVRYAIVLPSGVEENVKALIGGTMSEGNYCTQKVRAVVRTAYEMFGFSQEAANQRANEIVPNSLPRAYSPEEVVKAGFVKADVFTKGENGEVLQTTYTTDDIELNKGDAGSERETSGINKAGIGQ
ncbi:MAG: hypothetical protein AB7V36_07665 [Bacteroidales bacterium]